MTLDFVQKAKEYAVNLHRSTNHKYDGREYFVHLEMVAETGEKYIHCVPIELRSAVRAALWLHDTIERINTEYVPIKKEFGTDVAEMVYAVFGEKGRYRKHRHNPKYFKSLRETKGAVFVKLCDRIANIEYSIATKNHSKCQMYFSEHEQFVDELYTDQYAEMFDYLKSIFPSKYFNL